MSNASNSKNKSGAYRVGYHRTDGHHPQGGRSRMTAEDRLNRLKESVNAACTAFFARRGMSGSAAFNLPWRTDLREAPGTHQDRF
jgi:hypothetical protein